MFPQVSIVILNWNGWIDTLECLESLYQIVYPNYNIILVDNGSKDQSIEKIRKYAQGDIEVESDFFDYNHDNKPLKVLEFTKEESEANSEEINDLNIKHQLILIKNIKNEGFTEGNNIGIRFILKNLNSKYILLLNNDTVVDKSFLTELIDTAGKNTSIGICGPKTYYYDDPDKIQSNGGKINMWFGRSYNIDANKTDLPGKESPQEVDFVMGSALLFKTEVALKIGLLYAPYFAYWEETDWCIRAKKEGYKVMSVPASKIWHKSSVSLSDYNPLRIYYILRNNIIFMRRNAKKRYLPSFFLFYFILRMPSFIVGNIFYNSNKNTIKLIKMTIKAIKNGLTSDINTDK